jgi:hypothetical protein
MRALAASSTISNGEDRTWVGFGVELGLGVLFAEVIDAAYQEVENPVGKLVNQIQTDLRTAENLIVNGDDNRVGLRNTLQQVVLLRNQIRNEALLNMLHLSEEVTQ